MVVSATDFSLVAMSSSAHGGSSVATTGMDDTDTDTRPTEMVLASNYTIDAVSSSADESSRQDSSSPIPNSQRDSFNEKVEDITADIIICVLVAAFVALQYRDIIQTCH